MKSRIQMNRRFMLIACVFFLSISLCVRAEDEPEETEVHSPSILQVRTDENEIKLYIKDAPVDDGGVSLQIGNVPCDTVSGSALDKNTEPIHTLILVDNSASIGNGEREIISDLIHSIAENRMENEAICLATYGESVDKLSGYLMDSVAISNLAKRIEYSDKHTFLTRLLYEEIKNTSSEERDSFSGFRRFIIITDGEDYKEQGITTQELYDLIRMSSFPIHTVGVQNGKNNAELESLFALSRLTNGVSFAIDKNQTAEEMAELIASDKSVTVYRAAIPDSLKAGNTQGILLTFSDGSSVQTEAVMPFKAQTAEAEETIVDVLPEENVEEQETKESFFSFLARWKISIIIGVLLIMLSIILVVVFRRKKSHSAQGEENEDGAFTELLSNEEHGLTEVLTDQSGNDRSHTTRLFQKNEAVSVIKLVDCSDNTRIFRCPIERSITVGRDSRRVDLAISYDKTVSRKQCRVTPKNGRFYIEDLGAGNTTKLNGRDISGEREIETGDIIKMGRLEMEVTFDKAG